MKGLQGQAFFLLNWAEAEEKEVDFYKGSQGTNHFFNNCTEVVQKGQNCSAGICSYCACFSFYLRTGSNLQAQVKGTLKY